MRKLNEKTKENSVEWKLYLFFPCVFIYQRSSSGMPLLRHHINCYYFDHKLLGNLPHSPIAMFYFIPVCSSDFQLVQSLNWPTFHVWPTCHDLTWFLFLDLILPSYIRTSAAAIFHFRAQSFSITEPDLFCIRRRYISGYRLFSLLGKPGREGARPH